MPEKFARAKRTQALTERTLALVPRAKYPHCSARARDGLVSLPPLHSLTHLLHRLRRSLPLISKSSNLTRPSMQTAGAPRLQRPRRWRSSRGSNLHCVPVLADRARAWRQNQDGRATSSGQKRLRREALPIAEGKAICTARLRPVPGESINRETGQLLVAPLIFRCIAFRSRALHSQNWADSLRKPN